MKIPVNEKNIIKKILLLGRTISKKNYQKKRKMLQGVCFFMGGTIQIMSLVIK